MSSNVTQQIISGTWKHPALVTQTAFAFKSLCDFIFNPAVGCGHACSFCYVAEVATIKQTRTLKALGVSDPDADWGSYVFPRRWDKEAFLKSVRWAARLGADRLKPEGHRAVMFSSTTDAYQLIRNINPVLQRELNTQYRQIVIDALTLIRDESDLNVRILTRSPLARQDFELMKSFGKRLLFGMSLPTLNDRLAKIYEPSAPGVQKRLETLRLAKKAGLQVYVAVAPTYPDCDEGDIRETLKAMAEVEPVTVFHEPINIRAENVARIQAYADSINTKVDLSPFGTQATWARYAEAQLRLVEGIAAEVGLSDCLHLWPDKELVSPALLREMEDPTAFVEWITRWWTRISEWPA